MSMYCLGGPQLRPLTAAAAPAVPVACARDFIIHDWMRPVIDETATPQPQPQPKDSDEPDDECAELHSGSPIPLGEQRPNAMPRRIKERLERLPPDCADRLRTTLEAILAQRLPYLGGGVYGSTYLTGPDSDWVVKHAVNDGTRLYLEWCLSMQRKGKGMRGMPEIEFVSDVTSVIASNAVIGEYYAVGMRRYWPVRGRLGEFGFTVYPEVPGSYSTFIKFRASDVGNADWCKGLKYYYEPVYSLHLQEGCPDYLIDLVSAIDDQFGRVYGGCFVNDFHSCNVMHDGRGTLILTDPSSCSYTHWYDYYARAADGDSWFRSQ